MAARIDVVIAATSRAWATQLTEWISDHGDGVGLRNHFLFERTDALSLDYDCLVIDAESSLLDTALVDDLRRRRRCIVGVFHPDEPDGRRRLLDLGVDWVASATDPPKAILDAIAVLVANEQRFRDAVAEFDTTDAEPVDAQPRVLAAATSVLSVVTGAIEGAGASEIAIELTAQLRQRDETAALVDADLVSPTLAQRLQTPQTANVFAAVDAIRHTLTDPAAALTLVAPGGFDLLGGAEHPKHWQELDAEDLIAVLDALRARRQHVVVNIGSQLEGLPYGRHDAARAVMRAADRVLVAIDATPQGVVQLSRWMVDAVELTDPDRIHVVVNRSDARDARAQLDAEILRTVRCAGVWHVPTDRHVRRAAWACALVVPGRFTKAVAALAAGAVPRSATAETRSGKEPAR